MASLKQVLNDATPADPATVRAVISKYESSLTSLTHSSPEFRTFRWKYYRPIVDLLDETTKQHGWEFYDNLLETYSPRDEFTIPACSHILVNGVGRFVVRTRFQDRVSSVPESALRYLRAYSSPSGHFLAQQEALAYGWGIDHPVHSVSKFLYETVENKPYWVRSTLELAFYADQQAATDLLERLLLDNSIEFTVELPSGLTVSKERFLVGCLAHLYNEDSYPSVPRYWAWWDEFEVSFDWEPSIETRLQTLLLDSDLESRVRSNGPFQDLHIDQSGSQTTHFSKP